MIVDLKSFLSEGHRAAYDDVLVNALAERGVVLAAGQPTARATFFPMLDDNISCFVRVALVNAILGKRTVGLFFRARECFQPGFKHRLKRVLFSVLKNLPGTQILTIVPFYIDPCFKKVANSWIHDPQLWDLDLLTRPFERKADGGIPEIRQSAAGRETIIALGGQNKAKGFDCFTRLWCENESLRERFLFVAAGVVAEKCKENAKRFEAAGGLLYDRFISDAELMALYDAADIIWSCYSPRYNQASGIFGRAFQLGKPTLVREGSYIHELAKHFGHAALALPYDDAAAAAAAMLQWRPAEAALRSQMIEAIRDQDLATLLSALEGRGGESFSRQRGSTAT